MATGRVDLNAIVPETIQTIHFRKGTYFADVGDFSAAGSAAMDLFDRLPDSFLQGTGGKHDYYRLLGGVNLGESGYVVGDYTSSDGPWTREENLEKINVIGRVVVNNWSFTGVAYSPTWDSTDQIPQRAIDAGIIGRLGAIDTTDGGESSRYIFSLRNRDLEGWNVSAYAQNYSLKLWSNFTYFLDDPVNGDQFLQRDERWIYGGSVTREFMTSDGWTFTGGGQFRYDDIGRVGLYHTKARQVLSTTREDSVGEWQGALWAQAEHALGPVRATLGRRFDAIGADVDADNSLNSGSASDNLFSPKLALAWRASETMEFYGDIGRGFHSNDARGSTINVDPLSGDLADKVDLYAPATGAEIGARWSTDDLTLTATAWWLRLDSELVFIGDAGGTEPSGATERSGLEFLADWRPMRRLSFDMTAAFARARILDSPGEDRIPNALEYIVTGGVSALITDDLTATVTLRHLGEAPLIEDNSVRSKTATVTNALLRYRFGRFTLSGEVLNVFDTKANDIQYFYTSRLPGEDSGGVDDLHIHPAEPRTWRLSLRVAM